MIKNRLKQIRHELQIDTQVEMAQLVGVQREQYHRYERQGQQPTLELALRIAAKLNRPVEEIFYIIEPDE
ncbi:MAG: helix-turn-helix transcriptional regulator [Ignavibacteriales bacterium]